MLDTETHTWFQPRVALGKGPTPRAYHTTTRVGSGLYIFGGSTAKKAGESGLLGDLIVFDLVRMAWETKDVRGKRPRSRFMHSAELCEGKLFIFGGSDGTKSLSDIGVLDVTTMLAHRPDGHMAVEGDCLHWCLPGPYDLAADVLHNALVGNPCVVDNGG